jgi:hypothetical protein
MGVARFSVSARDYTRGTEEAWESERIDDDDDDETSTNCQTQCGLMGFSTTSINWIKKEEEEEEEEGSCSAADMSLLGRALSDCLLLHVKSKKKNPLQNIGRESNRGSEKEPLLC